MDPPLQSGRRSSKRYTSSLPSSRIFRMVMTGAAIGAVIGLASVRSVKTLLYGVKESDPVMLAGPTLFLLVIALLSALPVIVRASRIDPKMMLRAE